MLSPGEVLSPGGDPPSSQTGTFRVSPESSRIPPILTSAPGVRVGAVRDSEASPRPVAPIPDSLCSGTPGAYPRPRPTHGHCSLMLLSRCLPRG